MKRTHLWIFLILFASSVWGQTLTGTIQGTITDPSGAVIPDVRITVRNTGTNQSRTTETNASGNYSLPSLPVGAYEFEASRTGFNSERQTGITLQIDQSARLDVTLEAGTVAQVIEVVADAPLLQTDESSIGSVIDSQKIESLPLNGRNFDDLVQLVPGVVTHAEGSELSSRGGFNVVGMDENFTSFFLDGFDNVDPVLRNFSFQPSIDLLQEFKVEQSSYAAEFGRNAGAVINATTKSGSNEFHGSVWEFLRNDDLDARNVFASGDADPSLIRNQFGATFGGPILEDRTFFFASYEGFREKRGDTRRATVPTLLMRNGDFSELLSPPREPLMILDPLTGEPFEDNVIPLDRMNPITRDVIQAYPLPNVLGVTSGNRIEVADHIEDSDDISIRLDHRLFGSTNVMARYTFSDARVLDPFWTDTPGTTSLKDFPQTFDRIRTNMGIGLTTPIGNNTVHEFRIGYNRFKQPQTPQRQMPANQMPIAGVNQTFLNFRPIGFDSIGSNRRFLRVANVYNFIDQLSWFKGNHQLKLGLDLRRYDFFGFSANPNRFIFAGAQTGNGLADMFLGLPVQSISFGGDLQGNSHKTEFATYVQDNWQVTPNLTLNYGLRWEWYGRVIERDDEQSNWEPGCNCIVVAGEDTTRQMVDDDLNNFAPRFGFAYRPGGSERTVIRAGGGIYYDNQQRHNFFQIVNPPFGDTRIGFGPTIDDPFSAGVSFPLPFAIPKDYRDTYAEHWNLGIQHEILPGTVLDIAYVGNHVLKAQRLRDINSDGDFEGFGPILMQEQAGSSIFHSLQVRAERRFADGLALLSSYTWGHAIDDRPGEGLASQGNGITGFQDNSNPRVDRADADFDVRHRYTLSYVYALPDTGYNGAVGHLINGWGFNGILTLQSGRPFTINMPGSSTRPDVVRGIDPVPADQGPDNWIDPAAFTAPAGPFGDLGRNTARGPALRNLDVSIVKNFEVSEDRRLQFRTEIFNLTNTANFGLPNRVLGGSNFGLISSTVTTQRQIQFGLRYQF